MNNPLHMWTSILFLAFSLYSPTLSAAPASRFKTLPEDSALCKEYLHILSATESTPPPLCGSSVDLLTGVKLISWEELNLDRHLQLLQRIEWILRGQENRNPPQDFNTWLKDFKKRSRKAHSLPHLKSARVRIDDLPFLQTIYSYSIGSSNCTDNKPKNTEEGYGEYLLFETEVKNNAEWSWKRGYPFLLNNRLHLYYAYLSDRTHYTEWSAVIKMFNSKKNPQKFAPSHEDANICNFQSSDIYYKPSK